jgi:hypothetical protein
VARLTGCFKTGEKTNVAVFVAYEFDKAGKVTYEWAFYDTGALPKENPYSAAPASTP